MKYKIGIWGQYGAPGQKIADGQAVRTTVVTRELENRITLESQIQMVGKKGHLHFFGKASD